MPGAMNPCAFAVTTDVSTLNNVVYFTAASTQCKLP